MAAMINEDQLEQLCIDWFRDGGYEYAYGPDIAHDRDTLERTDYRQVILTDRLPIAQCPAPNTLTSAMPR